MSRCCLQGASGRDFAGRRFGPRPLDLDIIFYSNQDLQHDRLSIPHPRWQERDFVKAPLSDLFSPGEDVSQSPWSGLVHKLADVKVWKAGCGKLTCVPQAPVEAIQLLFRIRA